MTYSSESPAAEQIRTAKRAAVCLHVSADMIERSETPRQEATTNMQAPGHIVGAATVQRVMQECMHARQIAHHCDTQAQRS